jgi:predicted DNA-binding transcriptional regulator AlpA
MADNIDRRNPSYSVAQVAIIAGCAISTVYKAWHAGKFPSSSKVGSLLVVNRFDLENWLEWREKRSEDVER